MFHAFYRLLLFGHKLPCDKITKYVLPILVIYNDQFSKNSKKKVSEQSRRSNQGSVTPV